MRHRYNKSTVANILRPDSKISIQHDLPIDAHEIEQVNKILQPFPSELHRILRVY